ncbi:MAG: DUF3365 domain-containing protein [Comamonadaceae bacterium]|nr:DUF3365 domain-containing protein [Comamonadaceae bacterium]
MNFLVKLNLQLVVVFAFGLVVTSQVADNVLQTNAKREVISHARLMMDAAMAARAYTNKEIKPLLANMQKTVFLPQSVPSYAATQSFNTLRETHTDYSYKEATLNPTNPRDRVTDWESDVVQNFRDHPELTEFIGERASSTGPSLFLARPIQIKDGDCLQCHSTASAAPAPMRVLYGSDNGFGWKLGEIVGSQIVSVPLSVPILQANQAYKLIMMSMVATFIGILLLVNLILHLTVLRPMSRIARIANDLSEGKANVEQFKVTGNDEIAVLGKSFDRMRRSLEKAMKLLG